MAQDPVQLIAQAKKAHSNVGGSFFNPKNWFSSKTDSLENAAELYTRAAAAYRAKRAMREAGMAYEKAAKIQGTELNEPDDMANTLQEAFKVYKEDCPEDAARCLSQAIDHYVYKGNYRRAATQKQTLGEMYEQQKDTQNARLAFSETAQWFYDDNAPALANKWNLKAAEFAALDGDYLDAAQRFDYVIEKSQDSPVMKFSQKIYFLNAGICHLALDIIGAKRALQSYREKDSTFPATDQYKLLADLTEIVEQGDSEAFVDRLKQWEDKGNKLPDWQIAVFRRINDQLKENEEDFS